MKKIKHIANFLSKHIRSVDIIGRQADGFAIVIPETDEKGAFALKERLKEGISKPQMIYNDQKTFDLSTIQNMLSIGTATYPIDSHLPKRLFHIARSRLQMVSSSIDL